MVEDKTIVFIRTTEIYNDSRATKEIIALAQERYNIVVLGWNRNGCAIENCQDVFKDYSSNIQFIFFEYQLKKGMGIKNINVLFRWFKWLTSQLKKINYVSAVHACDLDSGISAFRFCKKQKIPLIYDIYDYYIDSHHIPWFLRNLVERREINIINFASTVIICTEERMVQIAKSKPQKVEIIHNSPDVREIKNVAINFDYVYCGSLAENRLIGEILNDYEKNFDLIITFAGHGTHAKKAKELSEKYPNFNFLGDIKYSQVIELESAALALSAIYEPTFRNHKLCAPNKFYEAMALKKPVIVCKGTGIDTIVKENNLGYIINYSSEEFYNALRKIKENVLKSREMGERGGKLYEEKYSWKIMDKRLKMIYDGLL